MFSNSKPTETSFSPISISSSGEGSTGAPGAGTPYKTRGTQLTRLIQWHRKAVAQGWCPSILAKPDYELPHNKVSLQFISWWRNDCQQHSSREMGVVLIKSGRGRMLRSQLIFVHPLTGTSSYATEFVVVTARTDAYNLTRDLQFLWRRQTDV